MDYGEPRAIAALSQLFDALPVSDQENPFANQAFIELRGAIEELGGHLTAEQVAKAERADIPRRRFAAQMEQMMHRIAAQQYTEPAQPIASESRDTITRQRRKIGRNEPCWCGSGKKYKRCHLDLER